LAIFCLPKVSAGDLLPKVPPAQPDLSHFKDGGLFAAAKFLSLFLSFWHEACFERELKELTPTTTQEGGGEGTIEKIAKVI
jgi:hypothetical protein